MKRALWTDDRLLRSGTECVPFLLPFVHNAEEGGSPLQVGRFDRYVAEAPRYLARVDRPAGADLGVLPFSWKWTLTDSDRRRDAERFAHQCAAAGIPCLIFFDSDVSDPVPIEGAVVYRTSLRRSRRRHNEHAMPGFSVDLLHRYGKGRVSRRPRGDGRPVVSFCGFAPPTNMPWGQVKAKERVRLWLTASRLGPLLGIDEGHYARHRAMKQLQSDRRVQTQFIVRSEFAFDNQNMLVPGGLPSTARHRQFYENMRDSDLVLAARGFGNYSHRLYEALSIGRVPLFIDTDCVLPDGPAWDEVLVTIPATELHGVADTVTDWWDSLSDDDYRRLQSRCRMVWEDHLAPDAFFRSVVERLVP